MHTPGPWFTESTSNIGHVAITDNEGYTICNPSPMGASNARLIAAAPDMLAALQWALAQIEDSLDPDHQVALESARACVRRATGGA